MLIGLSRQTLLCQKLLALRSNKTYFRVITLFIDLCLHNKQQVLRNISFLFWTLQDFSSSVVFSLWCLMVHDIFCLIAWRVNKLNCRFSDATYNCPWEKHGFSRLTTQTLNDWPWDLFMVIAKASRTGNCSRLNPNYMSVGTIRIRGINTSYPLYFPFRMVASMTLFSNFFTASRLPLQGRGWLIFHNIMGMGCIA